MDTSFKKLLLNTIIASTFFSLTACDNESLSDIEESVEENNSGVVIQSKVLFDPANGVLSVPNDILFQGTTDGTLNIPVDDTTNISDPSVALNATDGWSTTNPFVLAMDLEEGVSLDVNSVRTPGSVRIFESVMGGPRSAIEECRVFPSSIACQIVKELTFGVDFFSTVSGSSIAVVPTLPLEGDTTYIVVLTDQIIDSNGNALAPSDTYSLLKQDLNTAPLGSEAQRGLQAIINSFESAVSTQDVDSENIVFSMAMTTQSTLDVLSSLKGGLAQSFSLGAPIPEIVVSDTNNTIAQVLANSGIPLDATSTALFSSGNVYLGSVTLPYYLGIPSDANPIAPFTERWNALCDSGATLAGIGASAIADGIAASIFTSGPLDDVCTSLGLRDLGIDTERHLTKFNPVPVPSGSLEIDVQMTVPNSTQPSDGWPVIILQHGIGANKEVMLLITGALSASGFATIAIDLPLHGSRGFNLENNDSSDDIITTADSATTFINLTSLLTTRDNLRQSIIDIIGLRFSLNNLSGAAIDTNKVSFLGHSLGAIAGIPAVALANTELNEGVDASDVLDAMFNIQTASFAMPGAGIANSLLESPAFSDGIQSNLTLGLSEAFQTLVGTSFPDGAPDSDQLTEIYNIFLSALSAEELAALNSGFSQFVFAAETVIGSGDPINYLSTLAATGTPTHIIEVVGDGVTNLSDQVLPNTVDSTPLAGTEIIIDLLELPSISETTIGSGAVRFLNGHHSSILDPSIRDNISPSVELSARATAEMQSQVAGFALSGGQQITITDTAIVQ